VAEYVKVRAEHLVPPAQTLVIVDGHINPEYLIEVDAVTTAG
jgi:hypothetical protein